MVLQNTDRKFEIERTRILVPERTIRTLNANAQVAIGAGGQGPPGRGTMSVWMPRTRWRTTSSSCSPPSRPPAMTVAPPPSARQTWTARRAWCAMQWWLDAHDTAAKAEFGDKQRRVEAAVGAVLSRASGSGKANAVGCAGGSCGMPSQMAGGEAFPGSSAWGGANVNLLCLFPFRSFFPRATAVFADASSCSSAKRTF